VRTPARGRRDHRHLHVVDNQAGASPSSIDRAGSEDTMSDWQRSTRADYERKGFAGRSGYGRSPALLIVDFINGFTDPSTPLGGDFAWQINATRRLQEAFRRAGLPIVYTTIAYAEDLHDGGLFVKKVPSLGILQKGSPLTEVDQRIRPEPGEKVIEKKYASAFFGTELDMELRSRGIDTIVMAGCTTSGCIRASAIDSLQYGYHTIVVREAVGDRAAGPHEANLFDIDAKYADVVPLNDVLDYLGGFLSGTDYSAKAREDFERWWPRALRG
jgi:nicotinamidase-related amidase